MGYKKRGYAHITHKDSLIAKNLRLNHSDIYQILEEFPKVAQIPNLWNSLLYTSFFIKPYRGKQKDSDITFYDEREWRYTLPRNIFIDQLERIVKDGNTNAFLSEDEYKNESIKQSVDRNNEQYGLDFTPKDINYIIVENETEILEILREVRRIKNPLYSQDDVELLSTRIIPMERIEQDF